MKVARFSVSQELLLRAFHLPEDTTIVAVDMDAMMDVRLTVAHTGLQDGEEVGEARPLFNRREDGCVSFLGWGQ